MVGGKQDCRRSSRSKEKSAARFHRWRHNRDCDLSLDQRGIPGGSAHPAAHLQYRLRSAIWKSSVRSNWCARALSVRADVAQSGAFLPAFGKLHPRFGTPANAILLQTGLALTVLLLGAFDRVLAYIIFSAVLFLALTASTLFRTNTPVRGWWFPAAPILFILFCALIAFLILMHDPLPALIGVGIVLCGIPLRRFLAPRQLTLAATSERI
jgi:hypothetical protein